MSQHPPSDWKRLAEHASAELDPAKLMHLISELNRVLAERDQTSIKQFPRTDQFACFGAEQ
ncbi:MAG TPA: hypothetical protein VFA68_09900 [Terriglobales bacterium]|nr:hypothetical protein [Terriglobales bacterium]